MKRIAVVGAGSLGTITGALIADRGYEVELVDANAAHVAELNRTGARITGHIERLIPVTAKLPGEVTGEYDLVILLTKQVYTEQALEPFLGRLSPDGIVCTLQNGTPEQHVAEIVGAGRTLAGNVRFSAIYRGPGESELATTWEQTLAHSFDIGELDGSITDRLRETAEILSSVGHCGLTENITGMKWSKLLINSTFSGLSAACGCTFGEVIDTPSLMRTAVRLLDEGIRAGQAAGIEVEPLGPAPIEAFLLDGEWSAEQRIDFFTDSIEKHRHAEASMLQDLRKGIDCERDFINGRVIEVAERFGVEVPFNRLAYSLISQGEAERTVPPFADGVAAFEELLSRVTAEAAGTAEATAGGLR